MTLPSQTYTIARQLLLACLPQEPDHEHLTDLLSKNPDWDELYRQGVRHQVLPLLYQTLKTCPDPIVPASALNRLRSWFAAHALRSMQMQKELQRLIDLLNGENISVIPYKGPTLAEEAYGDIALRSFNDLDLLVPPEQAWDAVQVLLACGFSLEFDLPKNRWEGLQKIYNHLYLYRPEHEWGVEIHWALFNPSYLLPFDLSAHWSELKGGKEGRLDAEETLVMLCAHGTKHLWGQLKWLVDIDRLIRNGPAIDWDKALLLAGRSGSTRALLLGLHLASVLCRTPLSEEMVEKIDADSPVGSLTEDVIANLFPKNPERRRFIHEYTFFLKSREHFVERWKQILLWLFWPRPDDWQVFPLGDRYFWLYYVARPVRMIWKWVIRRSSERAR
jgi:hypothetical protein